MCSLRTRRYLQISLSAQDKEHIQKFLNSIESNHGIKSYKTKDGVEYSRVIIEDDNLFYDLISHGLTPRKTFTCTFPDIPEHLSIPFIRGYFDGDGCISSHLSKYGTPEFEFNITGTKEMLAEIIKRLPVSSNVKMRSRRNNGKNNYTVKYCGNAQTYNTMKLLYENASVYLERKYRKYQELANYLVVRDGNITNYEAVNR